MYLKHALSRYLKRFGTLGKIWKHGRLRVQYDTFWYDILTCSCNFENNEAKWCILTLFETYARRLLGDSIVLPFIVIDFCKWSVGPGLLGLLGATPVNTVHGVYLEDTWHPSVSWYGIFIILLMHLVTVRVKTSALYLN